MKSLIAFLGGMLVSGGIYGHERLPDSGIGSGLLGFLLLALSVNMPTPFPWHQLIGKRKSIQSTRHIGEK